ncbi:type II pantothenate kinase [Heyndrickxia sporothermodurans]|nr:type II pantothenate kinase [Heyndrickxia sporothermodurans]
MESLSIKKIGIDAGGTFLKIAFEKNNRLHTKRYPISKMDEVCNWLNMLAPDARKIITGGKVQEISRIFNNITTISEFEATSRGTSILLKNEHKIDLNQFIIVSIGTGTSIIKTDNHQVSRLLGTGIGGGTFTGLGLLLTKEYNYEKRIEMGSLGNRHSVDLVVSDIYSNGHTAIAGDLTAANFGKISNHQAINKNDAMAALINMIAETICLLVSSEATKHNIEDIVYVGGTLNHNDLLKKAIVNYQSMLGLETIFLTEGQFAGALGALYY